MAARGEQGVLDRPSFWVMKWRNGALWKRLGAQTSVGTARTYQLGEMPLPARPRPGLRSRHQAFHREMSSEAASSSSQLKAAAPAKRASVEEEVQTNETMEDLNETRAELDRARKVLARTQEDRDMVGETV